MPKRLLQQSGLLNAALAALGLYLLSIIIVPAHVLIPILNGIFLGLVGAVTVVFFPLFWRSIRQKRFDRVAQLTIGIILTWASLILSRSASTINRIVGPEAVTNTHLVTLAAYLAILGGVLHVTAPGMLEDKLRYNRGLLALSLLIGGVIAGVAIYLQKVKP